MEFYSCPPALVGVVGGDRGGSPTTARFDTRLVGVSIAFSYAQQQQGMEFSEHDFEMYYPLRFRELTNNVLRIQDKSSKRNAKRDLLNKFLKWIKEDESVVKEEFKESATEVIEKLEAKNRDVNR
jgi:hypothetical protein